jgi:hypothetical protein
MEQDGWLWFLIDVVFVAALGAALAYGIYRSKTRPRALDSVRDQRTRDLYDEEERREKSK